MTTYYVGVWVQRSTGSIGVIHTRPRTVSRQSMLRDVKLDARPSRFALVGVAPPD